MIVTSCFKEIFGAFQMLKRGKLFSFGPDLGSM